MRNGEDRKRMVQNNLRYYIIIMRNGEDRKRMLQNNLRYYIIIMRNGEDRGSPVTPGETEGLGHNGLGGQNDQVTRITSDKSGPLVGTLRCPQDSGR
ncbi:hypothetical protein RRG08_033453 [Elysia crispata]|uniref:Uncharacterized protein n=1 Tax=Elysia crispata TaxID=231223 RepID=A0AAE1E4F9_9GAST|nr:hypothetical protein RRG08_033453 [Elysia crispata]